MKEYTEKLKKTILPVLLIAVSYLWLGPLEVFFGNTKDFSFQYSDFFGWLLLIGFLFVLIVSAIVAALPEKYNKFARCLILWFGVTSYIQNMFLNKKLSEINGDGMDWESLGSYPTVNLVIWILFFAIAILCLYLLKGKWDIASVCLSGFLCAVQVVAIISLVVPAAISAKSEEEEYLALSGEKQFSVAENNNLIILLLDAFGTQQMEDILEKYPDALEGFEDFTYYTNADCTYYCTFPSLTHFLTGNELDFSANAYDWQSSSWNSDRTISAFELFHQDGYTCNLYADSVTYVFGGEKNLQGKWDNVTPQQIVVDHPAVIKRMIKISTYRYVPYVLKPYFEVLTSDFDYVTSFEGDRCSVIDNAGFYEELCENGLSIDSSMENAFILQLLQGVHDPYTNDAEGKKVDSSNSTDAGMGALKMVRQYLNELTRLGLYDSATVIVMGDHGSGYGDPQPLFMVKEQNEHHDEMKKNSAPISYGDLQASFIKMIGENSSDFGKTIYDWSEGENRERTVYFRTIDDDMAWPEGSNFNAYYAYTYDTDLKELQEQIAAGAVTKYPANAW